MRLTILGLMLAMTACAGMAPPQAKAKAVTRAAHNDPEDGKFAAFVRNFRATALAAGIAPGTFDAAMAKAERKPRVTELNLNQPEFIKPVWAYLDSAVSARRIADGKARLSENAAMLDALQARFGVPKEILVAIWGNESNYGRQMGGYNIFSALATLAYDGPRTEYARPQLIAALKMMQQQRFEAGDMTSSWAGAFGQTQFVPTTFLAMAVDGDGDGKIDMWRSSADALASAANHLVLAGWQAGKPWGYEVTLPAGFAYAAADLDVEKPVADWAGLGVRAVGGGPLSGTDRAAIYLPAGHRGPAFLVFANFKAILKYNNAASYALAVCLLADTLRDRPAVAATWPREEQPMTRAERITLQDALNILGFDVGKVDGLIGARTRAAVRAWQDAHRLPADGYVTFDQFTRIAMEAKSR